jgi:o-succinylbenzoate---CoA ligase
MADDRTGNDLVARDLVKGDGQNDVQNNLVAGDLGNLDLDDLIAQLTTWIGIDTALLMETVAQQTDAFLNLPAHSPILLIDNNNPTQFIANVLAARVTGRSLILASSGWTERQIEQAGQNSKFKIQNSKCFGAVAQGDGQGFTPYLLIPTGGTSGELRFAVHTWSTLAAAVAGFQAHFQLTQINSCCILPLYHVSGLMQVLRSLLTHGRFATFANLQVAAQQLTDPTDYFLSLVPTQLARILRSPDPHLVQWLSRFQAILLGGAPAWDDLLQAARDHRLPIAPTYGMTETASQVATLKPDAFLQGQTGCGAICPQPVLPHISLRICDAEGRSLPTGTTGAIAIQSPALALGYAPANSADNACFTANQEFLTDDLGWLDADGNLHLIGRKSQLIITGGEKVSPTEVEATLLASQQLQDVCVIGLPDNEWGEAIAALYVPIDHDIDNEVFVTELKHYLEEQLSKFKHPKRWLAVAAIPRNPQGKLDRAAIRGLFEAAPDGQVAHSAIAIPIAASHGAQRI